MSAVDQSKFYVTFVAGLNTEATKLSFPENAATDLDNVVIHRNGEVSRRLGVDLEDGYTASLASITDADLSTAAITTHEWKAVNGKGDQNILVIQIGLNLYFHNLGVEPLSAAYLGTLDLSPYQIGSTPLAQSTIDLSYGQGRAFVCNQNMDPIYITYDEIAHTFTATKISIKVRDFKGLEDGLRLDERPTTINAIHWYNLRNQGWAGQKSIAMNKSGSAGYALMDPVYATGLIDGYYPSNADIIYQSKIPSVPSGKEEVLGSYSPSHLPNQNFGNTQAPRGHYILDAFNFDYTAAFNLDSGAFGGGGANTATLTAAQVIVGVRPSCTAFYAGRTWYSGVADKTTAGKIYYSQILVDVNKAGLCYQDQDPTAEDLNSLLATDGGVIQIADMGKVIRMIVTGPNLVIIASNGVWSIGGPDGGNFSATDFTVTKVLDASIIGRDAVVVADGILFLWDKGGIWRIAREQVSQQLSGIRISRDTIQTFYEDIPDAARAYARAFYDDFDKKIYWFFSSSDTYDGVTYRFKYNRALVLDLTLNAFYTYTVANLAAHSPFIAGITQKQPGATAIVTYDVFEDTDDVVEGADDIVLDVSFDTFSDSKLKLLSFITYDDASFNYTFSEAKSRDFVDWFSWDFAVNGATATGANYDSFIQGGWEALKDFIRGKHITHVTSFFNVTETGYELDAGHNIIFSNPSGCSLQTRWDWTDSDNGRWTVPQDAYKLVNTYIPSDVSDPFNYGYSVATSKLRMRGHGVAFSFRYTSQPGKDFQLIGLAVNIRAMTRV
jgi:hypothetical protein